MPKIAPEGEYQQQRGNMDVLYNSDEFRMYCFKVLPCSKHYSHDWTVCPFAHPGEKARRRDPRVFKYAGVECPHVKDGLKCPRGDLCPFAHNIFECWLHPTRYRTQLCNEPASCKRKVCFFAHALEELREPSNPIDSLPEGGIGSGTAPLMSFDGLGTSGAFPGFIPPQRQSVDVATVQHLGLGAASSPLNYGELLSGMQGLNVQNTTPQQQQQQNAQLTQLLLNLIAEIDPNGQQQQHQLAKAHQQLQQNAACQGALNGGGLIPRWSVDGGMVSPVQLSALAANFQMPAQSIVPGMLGNNTSQPVDAMYARGASMESNIRNAMSEGSACHGRVSIDNSALTRAPPAHPFNLQQIQQQQQSAQMFLNRRDSKKQSFQSIMEDKQIRSSEEGSTTAPSTSDVSMDSRRTESYPMSYPLDEGDARGSIDCTLPESFILF